MAGFLTGSVRSSWSAVAGRRSVLLAVVAPGAGSTGCPALIIFHRVNAGRALVTSPHPGRVCRKPPSILTGRERGVLVQRWGCLTLECGEILALGRGAEVRPLPERKGRRPSWSQDPRRILGRHAEPTGTDGFRVLCRQFAPSSFSRQENCIKRCNTFFLKMKNPL